MKLHTPRLSFVLILVATLNSGAIWAAQTQGANAAGQAGHQQNATAIDPRNADAMPTIEVDAIQPTRDITTTIVVSAVKHGTAAILPILVPGVMLLFIGILLRMRRTSRNTQV